MLNCAAAHGAAVTGSVVASLNPSVEHQDLVRKFKISGDRLFLSSTWEYAGETLRFGLTWRRVWNDYDDREDARPREWRRRPWPAPACRAARLIRNVRRERAT
jgi:hypothetical protein